jgi:putative restriction endonuclease
VVNQYERAYRAWNILIQYASKRNTLTYGQLGKHLGIHHRPTRYFLDLIQNYCLEQKLPPLTVLAINQTSGVPGPGFIAWDTDDLEQGRQQVFNYAWSSLENPFTFASDNTTFNNAVDDIYNNPDYSEDVYARVKVRGMAQQIFRNALLIAYSNRCAFTGLQFCLDASHIIPWSESTHAQRMDIRNGILLSSVHHRLFDQKYITIDEEYKIRYYDPLMKVLPPYSRYDKLLTSDLDGKMIRLPRNYDHWPKIEWIRKRNSRIEWLSTDLPPKKPGRVLLESVYDKKS